jgi:hypothetical protein
MKKICLINYFIIFSVIQFNFINNEPIFVYEHVRHGARGPSSEYQSLFNNKTFYDEYNIHWDGDGELTLRGKMQHYILGIRNRYKYPNLLNYNEYNQKELLIHTTESNRVKESAYYQILGMFKPLIKLSANNCSITKMSKSKKFFYPPNYDVWKYKTSSFYKHIINEAELTIKYLEKMENDSNLFLTHGKFNLSEENKKNKINVKFEKFSKNRTFFKRGCLNHAKYINYNHRKNYQKLIKGILEKKYGNELQNFFEYEKKEWLYGIHRSFSIVDHYIVNFQEGTDLHYFLNKTNINKNDFYKSCKKVYEWWLFHIFCDKKTCVMESSKLMEDLLVYMDNKINNKNNELKMILDVGHDVTVAPMQLFMYKAFDVEYTVCFFACNIYFELHRKRNRNKIDTYYVRYYVDDDLRLNIIYDKFKKNVLENIWSQKDKDEFCRGNILKVLHPILFMSIYVLLCIIFGLILICVLYKYYNIYYVNKKSSTKSGDNENNKKRKIEEDSNNGEGKEMELIQ